MRARSDDLLVVDRYKINLQSILHMLSSNTIWMGYPCGRLASSLVAFISIIFNKKLVLPIFDLPVEQARDLNESEMPAIRRLELKLLERILVWKADVIVLAVPDFINYINPRTSNIVVFPSGVCEGQLKEIPPLLKADDVGRIITYAGSLDRSGMIDKISSMFSRIKGWQFWIAGGRSVPIFEHENTKYFGELSYFQVQRFHRNADAVMVPYPKKEYYMICIPLKMGEILSSCKPVISMRLPSIEKYLRYVGLEDNVIFVDESFSISI